MKERKPLFPEYIWMFFVGLLLAIIVCMRLIPGHADYIVADNPYNDNIIFITLEGKKIHFTSFMGNEIYSTINSNNSDWTEALESDIVSYANYAKLYFGEGNFSVVVVDNYSVSYNYNRFIQLIGPIVGTVYSSYYTGPSEDFLVLNNPWASLSENTFSEYYPTLYTLNLGGYLMPYYKLDPDALPTPTLSPTPTTVPDSEYFIFKRNDNYYMVEVVASGFGRSVDVPLQGNNLCSQVLTDYPSLENVFVHPNIYVNTSNYSGFVAYYSFDSLSEVRLYSLGTSLPSQNFEFIKDNYAYSVASGSSLGTSNNFYEGSSGNLGACGFFSDFKYLYSFSVISYSSGFYLGDSVSSSPSSIFRAQPIFFAPNSYVGVTNPLYWGYAYGFNGASGAPEPTSTPSPTVTPTQAPYVEVILPSGTPTPTPPVTFAGSDLPGGASGEGGSISGAGGMNAFEAESIYQYWTNKITNNQALAFLVSFFGLLPFDLVYALGTIIFILILLAMVRLFIHFIS